MGKVRLSTSCAGVGVGFGAGAGVNQQSDEGRDWHLHPLYPLYPPWPSGSHDPFLYSDPFPYSDPLSGSRIRSTLFRSDLRFPEIAGCLGPSSASEIASDAHPLSCNFIVEY